MRVIFMPESVSDQPILIFKNNTTPDRSVAQCLPTALVAVDFQNILRRKPMDYRFVPPVEGRVQITAQGKEQWQKKMIAVILQLHFTNWLKI